MKHLSYIRPMQTINVNKLIRYCTRLMLLSCAVMPAAYSIDWLYYSLGTIAIVSFLITLVYAISVLKTDRVNFVSRVFGGRREYVYDLAISIVGIIVNYSFGTNAMMCFWITALLLAVAELIPNHKKR